MTKEQSRYSFSECIDVRVVKAKDIKEHDWFKLGLNIDGKISSFTIEDSYSISNSESITLTPIEYRIEEFYNEQIQEQNIDRTYEDNDYVFLVEFER